MTGFREVAPHVRQICFRLPGTDVRHPHPDMAPGQPLRLGSREAEALAEVLQVFACGEESAAIAFAHLAGTSADAPVRDALSVIAAEETAHEALLRGLRSGLPEPARDRVLRRTLVRYYHGLAQDDPGRHLGGITSLDSAVCTIIAALLRPGAPLAREPRVAAAFGRIRREEAGHVRLSRRLAVDLSGREALGAVAERTRLGLVQVLALRGGAFDVLGADPDRLFAELRRTPPGLFA
ncbi:MAG TPA: hypothetical protein VGC15_23720 [Acetobacteraceae bacterium]